MKTSAAVTIGACVVGLVVFVPALGSALFSDIGLKGAWRHIRSEPWAYATLVDFVLGAVFASVYILARASYDDRLAVGVVWTIAVWLLGHGVTLAYLIVLCLRGEELSAVLTPLTLYPDENAARRKRQDTWTWPLTLLSLLLLVYFVALCASALHTEELASAWQNIRGDPWKLLTLVNNFCGVLFVGAYVAASEPRPGISALWLLLLLITGNAISMVYLVIKLHNQIGSSVTEAMVSKSRL